MLSMAPDRARLSRPSIDCHTVTTSARSPLNGRPRVQRCPCTTCDEHVRAPGASDRRSVRGGRRGDASPLVDPAVERGVRAGRVLDCRATYRGGDERVGGSHADIVRHAGSDPYRVRNPSSSPCRFAAQHSGVLDEPRMRTVHHVSGAAARDRECMHLLRWLHRLAFGRRAGRVAADLATRMQAELIYEVVDDVRRRWQFVRGEPRPSRRWPDATGPAAQHVPRGRVHPNVNVRSLFSLVWYEQVIDAFIAGTGTAPDRRPAGRRDRVGRLILRVARR